MRGILNEKLEFIKESIRYCNHCGKMFALYTGKNFWGDYKENSSVISNLNVEVKDAEYRNDRGKHFNISIFSGEFCDECSPNISNKLKELVRLLKESKERDNNIKLGIKSKGLEEIIKKGNVDKLIY